MATGTRALDVVFVSGDPLRHDDAIAAVADATCGAISTFLGTTRDSHGGRQVLRLTYEAHESMAVRVMGEIVAEARLRSCGRIRRVYVGHRIGVVPVGDCSVSLALQQRPRACNAHRNHSSAAQILIAASSPHRADAQASLMGARGTAPLVHP